jgi:hypothetical protein
VNKPYSFKNIEMISCISVMIDRFYNFLVVFIGGVVFSISPAIVSEEEAEVIKHSTKVNIYIPKITNNINLI